jgi:hypothetical protein
MVRTSVRRHLGSIVLGGLAFWVPVVMLSGIHRREVGALMLNVSSVVSLALVSLVLWGVEKRVPEWGWLLTGIYALGPTAMFAASSFSRNPTSVALAGDWIWLVAFCLLPPMTLWLAMLDGMIFSVIVVTLVLTLLSLLRR